MRSDVVPVQTILEQTGVKSQTVTGGLQRLKVEGLFFFRLGSLTVTFQAWAAEVHDPCILA